MARIIDGSDVTGIPDFIRQPWVRYTIAILIALMVFAELNPFVSVPAGHRGVVLNFGAVQPLVLGEGLHFRTPVMQQIALVDVRVQKEQTDSMAASKDLQDTRSTVAVNYHLAPDDVNWVYEHLGPGYKERIIDPAVQEAVKAVTAQYTAEQLITQREIVRSAIENALKQGLSTYHIVVDGLSIVNFRFSPQFEQAIEAKQTAEQLALKAQRDLARIKIEAEQKITKAQAEAEALRLQKANVTPELVKLRQIEATMHAIDKWDGHLPSVTSGAVPFIGVGGPK